MDVLPKIGVIALNTYREAVRARVLHGLFALAMVTAGYSVIVGEYASRNSMRVVSDVGAFSLSVYSIVVAIVIGATSLYRELELKTIFPILARPIHRAEYLFGKYLGTMLTLFVFMCANGGVLLLCLLFMNGNVWLPPLVLFGSSLLFATIGWYKRVLRGILPVLWAILLLWLGYFLTGELSDDRRVIAGTVVLTLLETAIVAALATLFSAFTSPFLTAVFTFGVFVVGRSADALASLPARVFGDAVAHGAELFSHVVPNLMIYVPPRPLLTGQSAGVELGDYLLLAAAQSAGWTVGLLALATLIFQRRDFV